MMTALLLVLAAAPAALAEGTIFFMGGDDNVTSATFVVVNKFDQRDILSITKISSGTGPALLIQKTKPSLPPLGCPDDAAKSGDGNFVNIYIGGPKGYDRVLVQMADINGFNTSHQLKWDWEHYYCAALVQAVPIK